MPRVVGRSPGGKSGKGIGITCAIARNAAREVDSQSQVKPSKKGWSKLAKRTLAIIGAGISGLTLAEQLSGIADVTVFEKSRGVGGRMATRLAAPYTFDHGTQFFTARSPEFLAFLDPLIVAGHVTEWSASIQTLDAESGKWQSRPWLDPHYVAVPQMSSLCKILAADRHVVFNTEVAPLGAYGPEGWELRDSSGASLGRFDWVISTAPPIQTARLLAHHLPVDSPLQQVKMLGCLTLMLGFPSSWKRDWSAIKVRNSPIEWIAVNSSKPGRNTGVTTLVVHSNNRWADAHLEDDIETTKVYLLDLLTSLVDLDARLADYTTLHRWRYALVEKPDVHKALLVEELKLASTGDWCLASRIEDAWLSARSLAHTLKERW